MTPEDKLRELYRTLPNDHRAIAMLEREVWALAVGRSNKAKNPRREKWFQVNCGAEPPTHVMFRSGLLGHEPWSVPLWSLIGKGSAPKPVSLRKAYDICLQLSDRADRAEEAQRLADNPDEAARIRINNSSCRKQTKSVQASPGEAREMRLRLRELIAPFVEQKLAGLEDPAAVADLVSGFEIEVDSAFTDLLRKLQGIRGNNGARDIVQTRRRDLKRACEFLNIQLPARGGAIDMDAARRAHRKLSAQLHPDLTNNNDQLTGQYIEVQKAWEIITGYTP